MKDNKLATVDNASEQQILEKVVVQGNIAALTPQQRTAYYKMRCDAAGLDWRTSPLMYATLQGKQVLYATKNAAEQLQATRNISISLLEDGFMADGALYRVKARAQTPDGRHTDNVGVVSLFKAHKDGNGTGTWLAGEDLANAIMKATTKAERRAVLGHCGMGMLDETEVESIGGAVTHTPEEMHSANAPVVTETAQPEAKAAPAKKDGPKATTKQLADCETARLKAVEYGFTVPKTGAVPKPLEKGATAQLVAERLAAYQNFITNHETFYAQQQQGATPAEVTPEATDDAVDAEVMDLDGTDYVEHLYSVFENSDQFGMFIKEVTEKQLPWTTNGDVVAFERAYNAQYNNDLKATDMENKHWAELATLVQGGQFKW